MKSIQHPATRGFTLVEMLVTIAVTTVVGGMVFLILNSGMVLYAKNTAVNSAHQQARSGVDQMLTNLHKAVSIPQLTDSNLQPVAETDSNGQPVPAAGISFQTFDAGPFPVALDAGPNSTSILLYCPGYTPPANARLNIPSHNIELDVVSSVDLGGYRQFELSGPIGTGVDVDGTGIEGAGVTYIITAFITTRLSYAVVRSTPLSSAFNGELRFYPTNNPATYRVITRNLISGTPFSIPLSPGGGLQNRYVAAVNLSTVEPNFTQRGYAAVNMFISSLIPFRCRLTNLQ
jgi:prepilin-type N-terminal cleavage/methylation domain-containing protein